MSLEKTLKAGAIVLSHDDPQKTLLLHRGKQNDWSFPKGHVEQGENGTEAMIREMKEETGLDIKIIQELPDLEYIHHDGGIVSTKMFLVSSKDDMNLKIEHEDDNLEWVNYNSVDGKLSYENLKNYYQSIIPILKKFIEK